MKSSKTFLLFSILFLLSLCTKSQNLLIDSLIHSDIIRNIVDVLASDSMKGRLSGSDGNNKAAFFIADQFEKSGIHPIAGNRKYFMDIQPGWSNIVGAIPGKSKQGEIIIFSAHYDHIGTLRTNPYPKDIGGKAKAEKGDEIYNGANDNASGVSAVISLARYFQATKENERTLIFVAFTGEEFSLLGSKNFAENFEPDSIIAVINIEMIGRGESSKSKPYITGDNKSDLINILNQNYQRLKIETEKDFFIPDPYFNSYLFLRSDNYPFAEKGIPAHSIMLTSPFDKYYHNLNDETGTLDFIKMKKIIQSIAIAAKGLVNGTDTPKRIEKGY